MKKAEKKQVHAPALTSLSSLKNELLGPLGTVNRDRYESELKKEIVQEQLSSRGQRGL